MTPTRAAIAAIVALALAGGGCSPDQIGQGRETLHVYVSAPLQGPRHVDGPAIEDGARLALTQTGRIGRFRVRGVFLDDSDGSGWTIARTAANARRAAQDTAAIGYVGDLDSGATRVSLPITNQAEIPQVSPASTAVDLTRLSRFGPDPDRYRPSDEQTFARVVPDDEVQARAAAAWAKKLGVSNDIVIADRSNFGRTLAAAFKASQSGGTSAGQVRGIYLAGTAAGISKRFGATPEAADDAKIFGSDALIDPAFLRSVAPYADRLRLTSQFLDPSLLPPKGQRFVRAFRARYRRRPEPAAAYGYEAMALLLDAIRRAGDEGDSRGAVADELLSTVERRSVLGTYSIDGNGDTTLDAVTGYRIADGLPVFPVRLTAPR